MVPLTAKFMSKLSYLDKPIQFNGTLTKKPIFLSDSKARYIQSHVYFIKQFGYEIEFNFFGGARFWNYFIWLQKNLASKVEKYGDIVLYIWLGTCDLTVKHTEYQNVGNKVKKLQYIDLRHTSDSFAVNYIKEQVDKFIQYVSNFPSVKIVFLEIPCYSIVQYNKHLRYPQSDGFLEKEYILNERIGIINDYIREVNLSSGLTTPRFKFDLIKYRKKAGGVLKRTLDYSGYFDGLHPGTTLAKTWMKRIVVHMLYFCR